MSWKAVNAVDVTGRLQRRLISVAVRTEQGDAGEISDATLIVSVSGLLANGCAINKGIKPGDGEVRSVFNIEMKIIKW